MTLPSTLPLKRLLLWGLVVTLLGFGLRCYRLTNQSLWHDEVASIAAAESSLDQIWAYSAVMNNSLPTYFLMLRSVLHYDNHDSEFRGRLLSALAGGASVPVFIGVVFLWRRHWGAALLAGLLLALNPLHLWYSQEIRAYALVLFFGLLTILFFELDRAGAKPFWKVLYIASALAAMALHKTGLVFPMVCVLWQAVAVLRRSESPKALLVHAPIALAGAALFLMKSYPPTEAYGRGRSSLEILYTFLTFLGGYSFGPSLTAIQSYGPVAAIRQNLPQALLLGGLLALLGVAFGLNWRRLHARREISLMLLGMGIVAAFSMISGFPYNVRYALPALPGFLALAAIMIPNLPNRALAGACLAGLLLVAVWSDIQWFHSPAYRKADARAVAQWLVTNKSTVKAWTVLPGYSSIPIQYYLQLASPDLLSWEFAPEKDTETEFPTVPDVLIIGRRHHLRNPDKVIAAYHDIAGNVLTNRSFAGFELFTRIR